MKLLGMMIRSWMVAILLLIGAMAFLSVHLRQTGLSARTSPSAIEVLATKQIRHWAVPAAFRTFKNPIPTNDEMLEHGRNHWADHCATCHANNGSGETEMGRNLYPRAPDMRGAETQSLTDGELYYIIRNGVPMTGMPAWGDPHLGYLDHDTWTLVMFIRHLPQVSLNEEAVMEKLNPKSSTEREEEQKEEDFLNGNTPTEENHEH